MKTFKLTIWIFLALLAGNISMAKASLDNDVSSIGICSDVYSFFSLSSDFLTSSFSELYIDFNTDTSEADEFASDDQLNYKTENQNSKIISIERLLTADNNVTPLEFEVEAANPIVLPHSSLPMAIKEIDETSSSAIMTLIAIALFAFLANPGKAFNSSICYAKRFAYNFTVAAMKVARVGFIDSNKEKPYLGLRGTSGDFATGRDSISTSYAGLLKKVAFGDYFISGNNKNNNIDNSCVLTRWLEAGCVILFAHIFNDKNSIVVRQLFWESVSEGFRQRLLWYSVCRQGRCRLAAAYSGFKLEKIWSMPDFYKSFAMSLPALSANSSLRAYGLKRTGEFIPFGILKSATSIQPFRQNLP